MNKDLKQFVDTVIRDYADKSLTDGYDICVESRVSLSSEQQNNLLDDLLDLDKEGCRCALLSHLQSLINERLCIVESEDRYAEGYIKRQDIDNGEITWSNY